MSATAKSQRLEAHDGLVQSAARGWDQFWFAPADVTTLAVIRILCGALTLYVHLAYSYDLQEFFGKDAWLSLRQADVERREFPHMAPAGGWYGVMPSLPPMVDPWTGFPDLEKRASVVRYIREVVNDPDPTARMSAAQLLENPPADPARWGKHVPPLAFVARENLPQEGRDLLAKFILELPSDQVQANRILNYVDRWGYDPRQLYATGNYTWSIWFYVTDPDWMVFVHCVILLIMLMFTLGLCTRVTSVLTWLAALSYLQRSPITLFGGDTMMNILLLYLMIGPSGAALSLDRLIARWWAQEQARRTGRPAPVWGPPPPMVSARFALRLLQIHFCIIYFSAGTSKLMGGAWWNGQAIYYTMANYEFAPLHRAYYRELMRFFAEHRWLWEMVMEGGSYFTLFLELSLPFLVWNRRLRPFYVTGAFALHTAIALLMGLVTFSLLMATMVLAFVPGETMRRLLGWRTPIPEPEPEEAAKEDMEEAPPAKKAGAASSHVMAKKDS
jgi:Vitamin K-dependent gamma-carboxylase